MSVVGIAIGIGAVTIGVTALMARGWVMRHLAARILATIDDDPSKIHEYATVDAATFPGVDLEYYDASTRTLESCGFALIADIEDLTLTRRMPQLRAFVRVLSGDDGAIRAAIYAVRVRDGQVVRTCELITEMTDAAHVMTSNAPASRLLDPPPQFALELVDPSTDIPSMLERHRRRLEQWMREHHSAQVRPVRTLADVTASWQRQHEISARHRKAMGGISRDEMLRLAGPGIARQTIAREIHDAIRRTYDKK